MKPYSGICHIMLQTMRLPLPAILAAVPVLLAALPAFGQTVDPTHSDSSKKQTIMIATMQDNKEIVKRLYAEVLNKHDFKQLPVFVSADYIGVRGTKGAAGFEEPLRPLVQAFPDLQWQVQEIFGEGNRVAVRWVLTGTHTGAPINGIPITGRSVKANGAIFFELKGGKIVSALVLNDRLGFLQELGVLPVDQAQLNTLYRPAH